MTNSEKYHFDDFTFDNYKRLIELAKEKGFQFILHKDKFEVERKDVIWRHDVEFEPELSLKMAQIESKPLTIVRNEVMKRMPKWVSEKQTHELYSFHL